MLTNLVNKVVYKNKMACPAELYILDIPRQELHSSRGHSTYD